MEGTLDAGSVLGRTGLDVDANAKKVVLFHHDPYHNDETIEAILKEARELHPNVIAAREGEEVPISQPV